MQTQIDNVNVQLKANIYFDGKVVSHTLFLANGTKKTIGIIYPGSFKFTTGSAERMEIIAGTCRVRVAGETEWTVYGEGTFFKVPPKSWFEITVEAGILEYLCSYE
jgi:uncharacterized protein YaiE (UPF0345 family)